MLLLSMLLKDGQSVNLAAKFLWRYDYLNLNYSVMNSTMKPTSNSTTKSSINSSINSAIKSSIKSSTTHLKTPEPA